MKYRCIMIGLLAISAITHAKAQMGAAQKMTYDKDTIVSIEAPLDKVWQLIKDPAKWITFSNGKITNVTTKGDLSTSLQRTISFADGSTRTDEITQYMPEHRFIVNRVIGPLPAGVKENIYMFSLSLDIGKGTQMKYFIKVDGEPEGKKVLLEKLKQEMDDFIAGIEAALESKSDQ